MKVIKHGKNYVRYGICECGCEFEYERKDVKVFKTSYEMGTFRMLHEASKKEIKERRNLRYYVICPECGDNIQVDREI